MNNTTKRQDVVYPRPGTDASEILTSRSAMKTELSVIPSTELKPTPTINLGTLQAFDPEGLLLSASVIAKPLARLINDQRLFTQIGKKKHVHVEGWTTLAIMVGLTPREVSVTEVDGMFTATVELVRMNDQSVLGRASAECGSPDDPSWSGRPRNARRSMAITRATSKVCRMTLSWIMVMAGYAPTPAEEMVPEYEKSAISVPSRRASTPPREEASRAYQIQPSPMPAVDWQKVLTENMQADLVDDFWSWLIDRCAEKGYLRSEQNLDNLEPKIAHALLSQIPRKAEEFMALMEPKPELDLAAKQGVVLSEPPMLMGTTEERQIEETLKSIIP